MEQASVQRPGAGRDRRGQVLHFSYVSQTHPVAASLSNYAFLSLSLFYENNSLHTWGPFPYPCSSSTTTSFLETTIIAGKLSHAHRTPRPGSCAPHPAHDSKQRISTLLPSRERLATPCALRSPLRPRTVLTPTHPLSPRSLSLNLNARPCTHQRTRNQAPESIGCHQPLRVLQCDPLRCEQCMCKKAAREGEGVEARVCG